MVRECKFVTFEASVLNVCESGLIWAGKWPKCSYCRPLLSIFSITYSRKSVRVASVRNWKNSHFMAKMDALPNFSYILPSRASQDQVKVSPPRIITCLFTVSTPLA